MLSAIRRPLTLVVALTLSINVIACGDDQQLPAASSTTLNEPRIVLNPGDACGKPELKPAQIVVTCAD